MANGRDGVLLVKHGGLGDCQRKSFSTSRETVAGLLDNARGSRECRLANGVDM
jgi:hypothetical protein